MRKLIVIMVALLVAFAMTYAGDFQNVGAKKCKMCHKGAKKGEVWEKWEKGPHAKAMESLKAKGEDKNAACLGCHQTSDKDTGVGCESCHGPGSAYKKMSIMKDRKQAEANGMVIPTEETCKKCHNEKSPTFKGFNFAEYKKKIDHTYAK